jgi:hypothetical protein
MSLGKKSDIWVNWGRWVGKSRYIVGGSYFFKSTFNMNFPFSLCTGGENKKRKGK